MSLVWECGFPLCFHCLKKTSGLMSYNRSVSSYLIRNSELQKSAFAFGNVLPCSVFLLVTWHEAGTDANNISSSTFASDAMPARQLLFDSATPGGNHLKFSTVNSEWQNKLCTFIVAEIASNFCRRGRISSVDPPPLKLLYSYLVAVWKRLDVDRKPRKMTWYSNKCISRHLFFFLINFQFGQKKQCWTWEKF